MINMCKKLTKEGFILKSNTIHGGIFDYSLVDYINNRTKIKIICPIHGEFEQIPETHLKGSGCLKCSYKKRGENNKIGKENFIIKANLIHDNMFDYSLVKYVNNYTKIKIICPIHGIYEQIPNSHLSGKKCRACAMESRISKNTRNNYDFINKANLIHNNKYNYSELNYVNVKKKIKIICPIHGEFEQTPDNHLRNHGCPSCNQSKGEVLIKKYLKENNINYISQKRFPDCVFKRPLIFDIYLPDNNVCIEYDGEQHFKNIKFWGGINGLLERQLKDKIKTNYCENKKIKLIRISYNENIIERLQVL